MKLSNSSIIRVLTHSIVWASERSHVLYVVCLVLMCVCVCEAAKMDVAVLDCKGRGGGGQRQLKYIAAFCEFGLFVRVGRGHRRRRRGGGGRRKL